MQNEEPGFEADLPVEARPGVPMTLDHRSTDEVPRSAAGVPQQPATIRFLTHTNRDTVTPVFGTASPPRGLSGLLRAKAYAIPEHKATHFLLLLLSDRVDVLEHSLLPRLPFVAALAVGAGVAAKRVRAPKKRFAALRRLH